MARPRLAEQSRQYFVYFASHSCTNSDYIGVVNRIASIFVALFLMTAAVSCSTQSTSNSLDGSPTIDSQNLATGLFPVTRNSMTTAEATAAIGCMGNAMSVPVNLEQYNDNASFESLYYLPARPWLVKLEEAGVASGRLTYSPDANQEWIDLAVRDYDMPSEAFSVAGFLDSRWLPLSTNWRDSLSYGLERVNAGKKEIDAASEALSLYGPEIESLCRIAIEGAIQKAVSTNLPFSSYVYIQSADYLIDWFPKFFTVSSLGNFLAQFDIQEN